MVLSSHHAAFTTHKPARGSFVFGHWFGKKFMVTCPHCGAQNPPNVSLCVRCSNLLTAPAVGAAPLQYSDPLASIIPTKNAPALLAYYLGLFSILPLFGLPMGIVAVIQGSKGWRMAKETPQVHGKAHAGIGIGCGSIGLLFNLAIVAMAVLLFIEARNKH